ncbi:hypothetical protein VTO42DRAFT_4038 [Malbranchea cinnamomea]
MVVVNSSWTTRSSTDHVCKLNLTSHVPILTIKNLVNDDVCSGNERVEWAGLGLFSCMCYTWFCVLPSLRNYDKKAR